MLGLGHGDRLGRRNDRAVALDMIRLRSTRPEPPVEHDEGCDAGRAPALDRRDILRIFGFGARDHQRPRLGALPWPAFDLGQDAFGHLRSEEHTSELQSLMRISYAVFCLKKKKTENI